jgi:hypothetical protein
VGKDREEVGTGARVRALEEENAALRARLDRIEARDQRGRTVRGRLLKGGTRLLLPAFDRQNLVRSFSRLLETASGFAGPRSDWPARDRLLGDGRAFLEAVVRFVVRRRFWLMFFGLVATAIPALQVWLLVQQNRIVENQNEFFEIQVYDAVARSMTEGDRNARLMTGALLAQAELDFVEGVVAETFDDDLLAVYSAEGVNAASRRLEDAAFRGYLVRGVVRAVERRGRDEGQAPGPLFDEVRRMVGTVLRDATDRVPEVLRFGRPGAAPALDDALAEQVHNYLYQVSALLRVHGRLARSANKEDVYFAELAPLLRRWAGRRLSPDNRFAETYRLVLQDLLFEVAAEPGLGDGPVRLDDLGLTPEKAVDGALERLKDRVPSDAVPWELLARQVRNP